MLTREDIRALRTAEDISFHSYDGKNWIAAGIGRLNDNQVFTRSQQELFPQADSFVNPRQRRIYVDSARAYDYEERRALNSYSAFDSPHDMDMLRTIFRALKAGDALEFVWNRSNNSPNLEAVGYVRDDFYLESRNESGTKNKWFVSSQVGPDNIARMIRLK